MWVLCIVSEQFDFIIIIDFCCYRMMKVFVTRMVSIFIVVAESCFSFFLYFFPPFVHISFFFTLNWQHPVPKVVA